MLLSQINQNYVFKTKIEIDEENFIELREPKQGEIISLSDDGTKNLEMLEKIFPACVIDSSFTKDDVKKGINLGWDMAQFMRVYGAKTEDEFLLRFGDVFKNKKYIFLK